MSKAILVVDMPNCCNECPICASYAESAWSPREYWCTVSDNTDVDPYDKPKWCPLKPAPKKDEVYYLHEWSAGYKTGWNDCVNYLVGE